MQLFIAVLDSRRLRGPEDTKRFPHVRDFLFGPCGILRSLGITAIEATHDIRWAAMVDSVYRIDETGNLVSCDSPVPSNSASGTDTNVSS